MLAREPAATVSQFQSKTVMYLAKAAGAMRLSQQLKGVNACQLKHSDFVAHSSRCQLRLVQAGRKLQG